MRKTLLLSAVSLLAFLFAACAPNATATSTSAPVAATESPTVALPTSTVGPTLESLATEAGIVTQALEATALPVATSRGPNLEATDPTTVSLASGGWQFVEFFRFT